MAQKKPHPNSYQATYTRIKAANPEASEAELRELTRQRYLPKTEVGKARVRATLERHRNKGGKAPKSGPTVAVAGRKQALADLSILEFASALGVSFAERPAQEVILRAAYGMPLSPEQLDTFHAITPDGTPDPVVGVEAHEVALCLGRRAGKTLITAICLLFECLCRADYWRKGQLPSKELFALAIAQRQMSSEQLTVGTCATLLKHAPPEIKAMIDGEPTKGWIKFTNGMTIQAQPNDDTASLGLAVFAVVLEEVGHWYISGKKADTEILSGVLPTVAEFGGEDGEGGKVFYSSTPAAKQGEFYKVVSNPHTESRLAFHTDSLSINPKLSRRFLARQEARDPDGYRREFLAEFAERVSAYFSTELIDAATVLDGDLPRSDRKHRLGIDQSGLSGKDKFAACIAHREANGTIVVDVCRTWDSKDTDPILQELKELAGQYGISKGLVDQYAGGWVTSALDKIGLTTERRPLLPKVYASLKSLLVARKVHLPANPELREGLVNTTAFYGRNNSLSIQHERGPSGHADLADAVATACWAVGEKKSTMREQIQEQVTEPKLGEPESFLHFATRTTLEPFIPGLHEPRGERKQQLYSQWLESEARRAQELEATRIAEGQIPKQNTIRPAHFRRVR